jgi:tetratricopeptide (TPR) repeat protein
MTTEDLLTEAMEKHQCGDLTNAEALYNQLLQIDPSDADALNLLGVLFLQRYDFTRSHDLIQHAISLHPEVAEYHNNLGQVFKYQGRHQLAMNCFQEALNRDPHLQSAIENLDVVSSALQSADETTASCSMKRYDVVQKVISRMAASTYLEIGIDTAESFMRIDADRKIGIDPVPTKNLIDQMINALDIDYFGYSLSKASQENRVVITARTRRSVENMPMDASAELFYMTSDEFFEHKAGKLFGEKKIDVAFIDGLHTNEQTYKDVLNVLDHLNDDGVILLHDCNPPTESSAFPSVSWQEAAKANPDGWNGFWCGDVWKTVVRLRSIHDDLRVFVLDCDWGIGVVRRGKSDSMLDLTDRAVDAMTFKDLAKNRHALLNLQPQEYLYDFLKTIG